jgi:hypothetical protein
MPTNELAIIVRLFVDSQSPEFPDLSLTCTGIRALPFGSFPPQNFAGTTNVAILRYLGAFLLDPTLDSNANVPQSILPLKETDLHVGFM